MAVIIRPERPSPQLASAAPLPQGAHYDLGLLADIFADSFVKMAEGVRAYFTTERAASVAAQTERISTFLAAHDISVGPTQRTAIRCAANVMYFNGRPMVDTGRMLGDGTGMILTADAFGDDWQSWRGTALVAGGVGATAGLFAGALGFLRASPAFIFSPQITNESLSAVAINVPSSALAVPGSVAAGSFLPTALLRTGKQNDGVLQQTPRMKRIPKTLTNKNIDRVPFHVEGEVLFQHLPRRLVTKDAQGVNALKVFSDSESCWAHLRNGHRPLMRYRYRSGSLQYAEAFGKTDSYRISGNIVARPRAMRIMHRDGTVRVVAFRSKNGTASQTTYLFSPDGKLRSVQLSYEQRLTLRDTSLYDCDSILEQIATNGPRR